MTHRRFRRLHLCRLEDRATPAQFLVTNLSASGGGSLRQAVLDSQAAPGADEIVFDTGLTGTIVLDAALPTITQELTITGPGAGVLTVNANLKGRHFELNDADDSDAPILISGLRLINGLSSGGGGAIRNNDCALTLTDVVIENCTTTGRGGAIYQLYGSLVVDGAVLSGNLAQLGDGGAISAVVAVPVSILNSTITGNRATPGSNTGGEGGGVAVYYADLTITNSVISGNSAEGGYISAYGGGGVLVGYLATATITNTTISGNTSARGGGGLQVAYATGATVENSTISGNTSLNGNGGGLSLRYPAGNVDVRQTTIAFNAATGNGGGASIQAGYYSGTFTFTGVIITSNLATGTGNDVTGEINASFSLIEDPAGATITGTDNQLGFPARLGMLTSYGGSVPTHLPASPSPARDNGPATSSLTTDQRGAGFPRLVGAKVDIGAVESAGGAPVAFPGTFPNILDPGNTPYTFSVTFADDTGIDTAKLATGDVVVVGPAGTLIPTLLGTVAGPSGELTANFSLPPAGGAWDLSDNGNYAVTVVANQVFDLASNPVATGVVGRFQVAIPVPLVVNAVNDEAIDTDGLLSLREALIASNASAAIENITFAPALIGQTITLNSELPITAPVMIQGLGADSLTIDANFKGRHFNIDLLVGGTDVEISDLRLINGQVTGDGGSIRNEDAKLSLSGIVASNNKASSSGGAIRLGGFDFTSAVIVGSTFDGNFAGSDGAAIFVPAGGPDLTVQSSRFLNNTATGVNSDGGAIAVSGSATTFVVIENSTFTGNSVVGGSTNDGNGGALHITGGVVTITGSTFNGNLASNGRGGAIHFRNLADYSVTNSTISGNQAALGGGIFTNANAVVLVRNSTIVFNNALTTGGGVNVASGLVTITSTIISGNTATTAPDAAGSIDADTSLISDTTGSTISGTFIVADPILGPLQDNGGPTHTHAITSGSPAFNAGSNPLGLGTDQRGQPRTSGAGTDIGAYEAAAASPPPTATIQVGDGSAQRSMVTSFLVTFSAPVNIPNGLAAAITLQRTGPGGPVGLVNLSFSQLGNAVTVTFDDATFAPGTAKSLIDGRYTLTLVAAEISNSGGNLDGNGNGAGGDDQALLTHRLFGDADGNASVDPADFLAFRLAFLGSGPTFDFDGDGFVGSDDFLAFRLQFLKTI